MNWWRGFEDICRPDEPLAQYCWYGLGGPARWFLTPRNEEELAAVVARCVEYAVPWRVLGRGANLLVRDAGFDGAVLKLSGPGWEWLHIRGWDVSAGAGIDFTKLVRETVDRGLGGLENLAGIPGSLGGIVRMNAGGKYGSIATYVRSVRVVTPAGIAEERPAAALEFAYRHTTLHGAIITAATLALTTSDETALLTRFRDIWTEKSGSQPAVAARSAGCIFKNAAEPAGKLIDQAGLKGKRCGGAEISTRHANFIIAHPGATAQDVLDLVALIQERVREHAGVTLELEIEVW